MLVLVGLVGRHLVDASVHHCSLRGPTVAAAVGRCQSLPLLVRHSFLPKSDAPAYARMLSGQQRILSKLKPGQICMWRGKRLRIGARFRR